MPSAFQFTPNDVVLVHWNDDKIYYAKIKRIDSKREMCAVEFDDKSTGEAKFSQIFGVEETTTDWIVCIICKGGSSSSPDEIVLCDQCELGFHQSCHDPHIPSSATRLNVPWRCSYCSTGRHNPHIKRENNPFEERSLQLAKAVKRKRFLMAKPRDSSWDTESPSPTLRSAAGSRHGRNSPSEAGQGRRTLIRRVFRSEEVTDAYSHEGNGRERQIEAAAQEDEGTSEESFEPATKKKGVVRLADCASEGAPKADTQEAGAYPQSTAKYDDQPASNSMEEKAGEANGDMSQSKHFSEESAGDEKGDSHSENGPDSVNDTYRETEGTTHAPTLWHGRQEDPYQEMQVEGDVQQAETAVEERASDSHAQHIEDEKKWEGSGDEQEAASEEQQPYEQSRDQMDVDDSRGSEAGEGQNIPSLRMDVNRSMIETNVEQSVEDRQHHSRSDHQHSSPHEHRQAPESTRAVGVQQTQDEPSEEQLYGHRDTQHGFLMSPGHTHTSSSRTFRNSSGSVTLVKTEPHWDYHGRRDYTRASGQPRIEPAARSGDHVRSTWMYSRPESQHSQRYTSSPTPNTTAYHRSSPDLRPHSPRSPSSIDSYRRRRGVRSRQTMARWSPPGRYVAHKLGEPPLFVADPYMSVNDAVRHGESNPNAVVNAPLDSHSTGSRMDHGRSNTHAEAEQRGYINGPGVLDHHSAAAASTPSHSVYSQQPGQSASHAQPTQYLQIGENVYQVIDPASQRGETSGRASYGSMSTHRDGYEQPVPSRHSSSLRRQERSSAHAQRSYGQQVHDMDAQRTAAIGDNIVARVFNAPLGSIPMMHRDPHLLDMDHRALTDVFNHHCGHLFEMHQKYLQGHSSPQLAYNPPARRVPPTAPSKPPVVQRHREQPPQTVQLLPPPSQLNRNQHHRDPPKPPLGERERGSGKHLCVSCRKPALMVCSMCQRVWYCGRECQLKAWKTFCANCG